MQWGGCGRWADGAGGKCGFDLFGPIWGYCEYTQAALEYMWVHDSWWAPAMGRWLHMVLLQACSGVVVVTGPMVWVVRVALAYLVPIWGYYEYTRAVLEYMWVCGSWWEPGTAPSGCTWGCCRHAVGWLWSLGQWCGW